MKFLKNEKGQSMVEFALVLPILVWLVFGLIDFGWLFFNRLAIENGAREGARYAAVNAADCTDLEVLKGEIRGQVASLVSTSYDVEVTPSTDGRYITVTVTSNVPVLTPVIGAFYSGNVCPMSSAVEMHIERII